MSFEKTPIYIYKNGVDEGAFLDGVSILEDYATLTFTKGHYQPGTFELTVNQATLHASDLIRGRILRIGEDNTKAVYISTIKKELQPSGNVIMTVTGEELWGLLRRRQCLPPSGSAYFTTTSSTPVETGVKTLIAQNAGASAVASRKFASLNVITSAGGGANYEFSERYSNLLEAVSKALLATNSGIVVTLNHTTKKWDLGWTAGTDRTATVKLSSKFNTAESATVAESDSAFRNVVIGAGQGEGVNRVIRTGYSGGEPSDLNRREIFRDMRDLSSTTSIDTRIAQTLVENGFTSTIEVSPLAYSRVVYDRNYFVGDKITFDELGVVQQAWITSATEQYKNGSYELKLGVSRAPATITGQVVALSNANLQAMATIEAPTIPQYPINPPSALWPFSDMPAIPDNAAGTVYINDPSWTGWGATGGETVTTSGGILSWPHSVSSSLVRRVMTLAVGQLVVLRVRVSAGTPLGNTLDVYTGADHQFPIAVDGTWNTVSFLVTNAGWVGIGMYVGAYATAQAYTLQAQIIYIGDGTYASTTKIADASGNGRTLSLQPGAVRKPGPGGLYAIDTTYGGAYGSEVGLPSAKSPRSLGIWFNSTYSGTGYRTLMNYGTAAAGQLCRLAVSGGYLTFDFYGASLQTAMAPYFDGKWHYWESDWDATTVRMFIDGTMVNSGALSSPSTVLGSGVSIGYIIGDTTCFPGLLAEPRIYPRALSAAEVLGLYKGSLVDSTSLLSTGDGVGVKANNPTFTGYNSFLMGSAVASVAGVITPTGPIFHVTGALAITGINVPYYGFVGTVTIIPDGAFTWTAATNIALAGTAVVNKAIIFTYDSGASKWYPSYT